MAEICYPNVQRIIQEHVARLQVPVHDLRPLPVEILHCLGDLHRPRKPLSEARQRRRRCRIPAPASAAGPVEPISEGGVEELCNNPRTVGRVEARARELEHEAVALPGEGVELLREEGGAIGVGTEELRGHALHRHVGAPPRGPVNVGGAPSANLLFQFDLYMLHKKIFSEIDL